MSGRLVGEVAEWLRTPAAGDLTLAERAVLFVIAERSNEKTREMWRHKGDEVTLFERICEVTGMDRSGLTKVLKKLAAHEYDGAAGVLEVRVQIGETKAGGPLFAYRGVAMRFRLPVFPASVQLPERVDERAPIQPVDNSPEGTTGAPSDTGKGWTSGDPLSGKGAPAGTHTGRKGGRAGTPNTSKDNPSTTNPSSCGAPTYGVAVEDTLPAAATPSGEPRIIGSYDPTYREASALLQTLPDLGGAYMDAARHALGEQTPLAGLVIHAAQLAKAAS